MKLPRKVISKSFRVLWLAAAILLGLALAAAHFINSPATGHIVKSGTDNQPPMASTTKTLGGKYLSFNYPANYQPVVNQPTSAGFLEVDRLFTAGLSDRSLSVSISRGQIDSNPGVSFRRNSTSGYQSQASPADQLIFTSTANGFERDIFIAHDDLVATIVAQGPDQSAVTADEQTLSQSLKWR